MTIVCKKEHIRLNTYVQRSFHRFPQIKPNLASLRQGKYAMLPTSVIRVRVPGTNFKNSKRDQQMVQQMVQRVADQSYPESNPRLPAALGLFLSIPDLQMNLTNS